MDIECNLCNQNLKPVIHKGKYWKLILNRNQNLLGKCFLVLNRHCEDMTELTPDEWTELHGLTKSINAAINQAFSPNHFNYAFLQNLDRHVHFHIIPRYASDKKFFGLTFKDSDYPGHYSVSSIPQKIEEEDMEELAVMIKNNL